MLRGLYNATASLDAAAQAHDVVANNLAHASMPGYRRRVVTQESFDQMLGQSSGARTSPSAPRPMRVASHVVFSHGQAQYTGNSLDVALDGDGFFTFQGPKGPVYSRNGVFHKNADGSLLSSGGLAVLGSGGPITLPATYANLMIRDDGTIIVDGSEVGKLQIAHFQSPTQLVPVGTTLFEAPPGVQPGDGSSTVSQGVRESSNVEIVTELVQMILGMRQYEASQRILKAISEAVQLSTSPQAG